ncbi:M3 family oligoendopeptidase [Alicyclobacillus mengziensis]|uniref:M3 family oligoendopeptidase n=1 Tax=Alicyclobacillus mengziensis TaxID=2931921 RepID=A0A9X7Z7S5_9BACL|nr:M3 family oligoendopeptidase [Alicyclobacillus mengziensis]QSO47660.1 M3 family oligoendopeptidase [Alicyclobacillus mengziensis]
MKFEEMTYERPDIEQVEKQFSELLTKFENAGTADAQNAVMKEINDLRVEVETMGTLAQVRHSIDTNDEFYDAENDYFDENQPRMQALSTQFYQALVKSPFRSELEQSWGKQLFRLAEMTVKTFDPVILADLQKENKLASEYDRLIASAKIDFEGEDRNLAQMGPFLTSPDREMRKRAYEARYNFFIEHQDELDEIYDGLVKTRTELARKLGYKTFTELGYLRLSRSDYNAEMVANFRKQVEEFIVPVATALRERQKDRIGVDELKYYDEGFKFPSGNPKPHGDPDWIVDKGKRMYMELSPETDEFFTVMTDNHLMDLVSKKGKNAGGYCTGLGKYKVPFIFSNFNGTFGDVTVLTHEAGHAFQSYSSRHFELPEYGFPTMESAEIHSMSMEFFTWPWMDLFFEEETEKFKFMHLADALQFIPYGVAVDEFQHFVYENPDVSPAQRRAAWRRIEKKYLPHRNYEGNDYLESGAFWHQQGHIFGVPFYYIDYTLAQICAFQFWKKANEDRERAWGDYLNLCKQGGSKSFLELVQTANLISPFDTGCVESVIGDIEAWLDGVNDSTL